MSQKVHKYQRKSIRLRGYDYSKPGFYFITIVTQDRNCLFGEISQFENSDENQIFLNDAGKMIAKWYAALENKFPEIRCHEMVIMPNHFHGIVEIIEQDELNSEDFQVKCQEEKKSQITTLPRVVQWFKSMTTNEYIRGVKSANWPPFCRKLWQRNYWEQIIRNEKAFHTIKTYIRNNPQNWKKGQKGGMWRLM